MTSRGTHRHALLAGLKRIGVNAVVAPPLLAVMRWLWRPERLQPNPQWRFGHRPPGASPTIRLVLSRAYRNLGVRAPLWVTGWAGQELRLDPDTDMGETAFVTGAFEPNEMALVAQVLGPGMTAIDVGANVGWYTGVMASSVGPTGSVISFEPSPRERSLLAASVRRNGLTWVAIREEAVFDRPGTIDLHVADNRHSGHNTVGDFIYAGVTTATTVTVATLPLDSLGLDRLDFIKLDVEGAETHVLRGAMETLRRHRPLVLCEVQDKSLHSLGGTASDLVGLLGVENYVVCPFDSSTGRPTPAYGELSSLNILAVPTERVAALTAAGVLQPASAGDRSSKSTPR